MRSFILFTSFLASLFCISCGSSRKAVSYSEDKAFYDVLKKLNKKPNDPALRMQTTDFFNQAVKQHQERITANRESSDLGRYDKIISEYNALQQLSDAVRTSPVYREVSPINYYSSIQSTKEEAAAAYYNSGLDYMGVNDRQSAQKAYDMFRKSEQYVPNYKDASVMMKNAYEKSIVNIVVNPPRNNGFYSGWINSDYRSMYLDDQVVRDLGGPNASGMAARFFTEADVRRLNVQPDWVIDIIMDNLYQQPIESRSSRNVSRQIQVGSDTSGKPIMQTVNARLHITKFQYPNTSNIEYRVTDIQSNQSVAWDRVPLDVDRIFETATYSGDSRALSQSDWALVNNNNAPIESGRLTREGYNRFINNLKSRIRTQVN